MRTPNYLSPSSIKTYFDNADEFYMKYLADVKPPRMAQTQPMAAGSAFDAAVKSFLYFRFYGNYGPDNKYGPDALFEAQVEEHNRDWAKAVGKHIFDEYKAMGALADLILEIQTGITAPSFEFSIQSTVSTSVGEVPILGKPDLFFINGEGVRVIPDWKVNGYCSESTTSPKKGYVKVRGRGIKNNGMPHKECWPEKYKGIVINKAITLVDVDITWADQVTIYGWLLGEEVGAENLIGGIEQICGPKYQLRFASHRCLATKSAYQFDLVRRIEIVWGAIVSGKKGYFSSIGLNEAESEERCDGIEEAAKALGEGTREGTDEEKAFAMFINKVSRKQ